MMLFYFGILCSSCLLQFEYPFSKTDIFSPGTKSYVFLQLQNQMHSRFLPELGISCIICLQ